MGFLKKLIITIIVIAFLGVGFYFIFNTPEEISAGDNPFLDLFFGDEDGGGIVPNSKEFIEKKISSLKENIEDSVKESIKEKEEEALDSLKKSANEAIDATQERIIGIGGSSGITVLPVAKINANAYFLISNPDPAEETQYEIDWGDGSTEQGTLSGESKTVSHLWNESGEFQVVFKTSNSLSESIKVVVTE